MSKVRYTKILLTDEETLKGWREIRFEINDTKVTQHRNFAVEFEVCPVQRYNMHRKVEDLKKSQNLFPTNF